MDENIDAFDLFMAVRTQWRASGFGVIGLDYLAVRAMAADMEIKLNVPLWNKIRALESFELARINKKEDPEDRGQR